MNPKFFNKGLTFAKGETFNPRLKGFTFPKGETFFLTKNQSFSQTKIPFNLFQLMIS